jgi:drug/metabolite transporter (DMT)-like permease
MTIKSLIPYIVVLIANILWSTSFSFQKIAADNMDTTLVVFWRYLFATISCLFLLKIAGDKLDWKNLFSKKVLFISVACYVIAPLMMLHGVSNTGAMNAAIMMSAEPIFTIIISLVFLKEKLFKSQFIGGFVVILGVLWFCTSGSEQGLMASATTLSMNLLILAGVFFESLSAPIGKSCLKTISVLWFAFLLYLYATIITFGIILASGNVPTLPQDMNSLGSLLYLGIGCTTIAYACWYWSIKIIGACRTVIFLYTQPVFASISSWAILGEVPEVSSIPIFALIISGLGICVSADLKSSSKEVASPA